MTRTAILAAMLALLAGVPGLAAPSSSHPAGTGRHYHTDLVQRIPRQCESQYNLFTGKWTTVCLPPMGK